MSASIDLDYDRAKLLEQVRKFRAMRERAQDLTPAWDELLTWFSEQNFAQWLSRGARYRTPWAPLAPVTLRYKFRKGYPLDPLIRTGALVQDLTSRPFGQERITPSSVMGGTTIRYAKFHMRGTRRMPARQPFSVAQIRKEQAATSAVANWIIKGERRVDARLEMRGPA